MTAIAVAIAPLYGHAYSIGPGSFANPNQLVDPAVAGPIINTVGMVTDHRAYEGASPLGTKVGFDLSVQATMVKLPADFRTALSKAGIDNLPSPIVPFPRLIAHKGLGKLLDVGVSWFLFKEIQVLGFDAKLVTYHPKEGPTWAFRINYTTCTFDISDASTNSTLVVNTTTVKPEILVSRKLDFAEPYMGVGYQMVRGSLKAYLPLPSPYPTLDQTLSSSKSSGLAFVGLSLRMPQLSMRLLIDGQYSTAGAHAMGAKFGLNF